MLPGIRRQELCHLATANLQALILRGHFSLPLCRPTRETQEYDRAIERILIKEKYKTIYCRNYLYLNFNSFKQHHNRVCDSRRQMRVLRSWVRFPPADLGEDKFYENWQRAFWECVRDDTPLKVGQITARCRHPLSKNFAILSVKSVNTLRKSYLIMFIARSSPNAAISRNWSPVSIIFLSKWYSCETSGRDSSDTQETTIWDTRTKLQRTASIVYWSFSNLDIRRDLRG